MIGDLVRGLLDGVPVPLILARDGILLARNTAADVLFPDLRVGEALPDCLVSCRPGAATMFELDGTPFLVTARATEQGDFLTLLPKPELKVSTAALTARLRETLAMSMSAVQVLAPAVESADTRSFHEYLGYLNKGLYQILRIVTNLEQTDSEQRPYCPAAVDLVALMGQLFEQAGALCLEAGVTLRYECNLPHLVTTGDAEKLIHMTTALLSNAVRAAGAGGDVLLRLTERNGRAILTLRDSGSGLTESDLSAYWSGGSPAPRAGAGLGLGLPLVRYLARLHDGAVMVETGRGDGLTATVSLPIVPPPAGVLHTRNPFDASLSGILVELSEVLPGRVFQPGDLYN